MVYKLMKKKIQREGLTEQNKELLGGRITREQYDELMGIA